VLGAAIIAGGTSFDSLYVNVNGESGYFDRTLNVYGREGSPATGAARHPPGGVHEPIELLLPALPATPTRHPSVIFLRMAMGAACLLAVRLARSGPGRVDQPLPKCDHEWT